MNSLKRIGLLFFILFPLIISSCDKGKNTGAPTGIGPEGGIVQSADGLASVSIPPGALADRKEIAVLPADSSPDGNIGLAYEFTPSGTVFSQAATISILFAEQDLPPGTQKLALRLGTVINNQWQIVPGSSLDLASNSVNAPTNHFSIYGILENTIPVANAGPDQGVVVNDIVQLDGSGSTDTDSDPLTFFWSLSSVPAGSSAILSDATIANPSFVADLPGTYAAQLIVNDGFSDSLADIVTISTEEINVAPVADAGTDQTVAVGNQVTLNASQSTDVNGDALTFLWSFTVQPEGSTASLSDVTAVNPVFTANLSGVYRLSLIVHDGVVNSVIDTVTISTGNSPPVSNAGLDQTVLIGDVVVLDASGSSDVDGDLLNFRWSLTSVPIGSTAILSDITALSPSFTADLAGTYIAQLIVRDAGSQSLPDTVVIQTENSRPVADAGLDQSIFVSSTVQLDGSLSADADLDGLNFEWAFTLKPLGSTATLSDSTLINPTFFADTSGTYILQLIADDGALKSLPDTVVISTENSRPVADAGLDQSIALGVGGNETVFLDGNASIDSDGDLLGFGWSLITRPLGSTASISDATLANASFVADKTGIYLAQLIVDDGLLSSTPDIVTITAENNPPVLDAIGNQTVSIGSSLSFQISASNLDGDSLVFSASPLPLPASSSFDASSGDFTFTPSELQVGEITLTFSVSDGELSDSETITIMVTGALPGGVTALKGRILDTNDFVLGTETPVVGAKISLLGNPSLSTTSAANGDFILTGLPIGSQILDIATLGASPAPDGSPYSGFREEIFLIEGVTNIISRPFFLPRIDVSSLTTVNPAVITNVVNADLNISLVIPSNTAKNPNGTNFTGQISISEVPEGLAPAVLPEELDPGLLITIQPVGVTFATPLAITFPNTDNLTPGSETDIWSLDPETGTFIVVGIGRVSADGSKIETISGGVRAADWHITLPPSVTEGKPENPPGHQDEDKCTKKCGGSLTTVSSGDLTVDHILPSYVSQGQSRAFSLIYHSKHADPRPALSMSATISRRGAVPPTVSSKLSIAGTALPGEAFIDTSGLSENVDEPIRQVIQVDANAMDTGLYPYRFTQTSNYSRSRVSNIVSGNLIVNNQRNSPIGAGWTLRGLSKLQENFDGSLLVTEGDGSALVFKPGPLDLNDWRQEGPLLNGTWRVTPDGSSVLQTRNANPTFFISPDNFIDTTIRGTFEVETTVDDDFIGFVFGYKSPIAANGDGSTDYDFLLFEWKQATQTHLGFTGEEGYTLSRVNGNITNNFQKFWGHTPGPDFEVLATDYGSEKGWLNNTEHNFELVYEKTRIKIVIDGRPIFNVPGTFQAGQFGFYNFSQAQVRYRSFTSTSFFIPPPGDFSSFVKNPDGTFTRTLKDGTEIHFDATGLQSSIVDRNGNVATFSYDAGDRLVSVTDPVGRVTLFEYAGSHLSAIIDPVGKKTLFTHDGSGNLIQIADPDGSTRIFAYDGNHRLASQTSKRGHLTSYEYDFAGRHIQSNWPDGSTRKVRSSKTIGLVKLSVSFGTKTSPAPVVRPNAAIATFTDGGGNATSFTSDRFGASTLTTDALGRSTAIVRNEDSNPTRITRANGGVATMTYDGNGNLLSVTEVSNSATTTFTYEPKFNQIATITDPAGKVMTQEYDAKGNLIKIIDPLGGQQLFTYDAQGLVLTSTDANGNTTSFTYDSSGNLETVTDALGVITKFIRNPAGNIITTTEAFGTPKARASHLAYDVLNRPISVTNAIGAITRFRYDLAGNLLESENATGQIVTRTYDAKNRVLSIDDPISGLTTQTYDGNGNLIKIVNALGQVTTLAYDAANQLIKATDALAQETSFAYDVQGNLTTSTDAKGQPTTFDYDSLSRQIKKTSPLGLITSFVYDKRDNLLSQTDPKAQIIAHTYDDLSRLTQTTTSDDLIQFTYDPLGNILTASDSDSSLSLTYDALNRVVNRQTADSISQPAVLLTNLYDEFSNRTQLTDSAGGTSQYVYDPQNRLTQLTTPAGDVITEDYDLVGRLLEIATPGAGTSTYAYDLKGRLESITHLLTNFAYGYDAIGNITSIAEPSGTRHFTYDDLQRLTAGGVTADPESYTYDEVGNRTISHLSTAHTYDIANRLLTDDDFTYIYDANGNLATKTAAIGGEVTTYTYDSFDRLTQVGFSSGVSSSYRYDALGRRIEKNADGVITRYVYDGQDILLEYDGSNVLAARYSHGQQSDQPLSMERGGQSYFYQADHLGSVRKIANSSGALVNSYDYDAYGRIESSVEGVKNPYGYTGREIDAESGLYHYRARSYDPNTGRFLQKDPIGLASGDNNPYRYVGNRPVNFTDPSGLILDTVIDVLAVGYDIGVIVVDNIINDCDNLSTNLIALGADTAMVFVPFATGGGIAIRAGSKIDDAIDASRIAKGVPKIGVSGGKGAGKGFSNKIKDQARAESRETCVFCGTKTTRRPGQKRSEIDHAIPKSRNGNNSLENAQNTCRTCNRQKGAKTTEEFLRR